MSTALAIFQNTFLQVWGYLGGFLVCGALLTLLSRWTSNAFRQFVFPNFGLYAFGSVGVPVHEFSHAFFCKIFGHRIHKVKWFDGRGRGGSHGAVTHSWNPDNLYHQVGRFFIGLGPVLLGPAVILALLWLLVPETRSALSAAAGVKDPLTATRDVFLALASTHVLSSPGFYLFLYLATAISSQLELSREDMDGALRGFVPIVLGMLVINLVLCLIEPAWASSLTSGGWALSAWFAPAWVLSASLATLNLAVCVAGLGAINGLSRREWINPFRS